MTIDICINPVNVRSIENLQLNKSKYIYIMNQIGGYRDDWVCIESTQMIYKLDELKTIEICHHMVTLHFDISSRIFFYKSKFKDGFPSRSRINIKIN